MALGLLILFLLLTNYFTFPFFSSSLHSYSFHQTYSYLNIYVFKFLLHSFTATKNCPLALLTPQPQFSTSPAATLSLQLSSGYFLHFSIFIALWLLNSNISTSSSSSLTPCRALICLNPLHCLIKLTNVSSSRSPHRGHSTSPPWYHLLQFNFGVLVRHLNSITELKLLLYILSSWILLLFRCISRVSLMFSSRLHLASSQACTFNFTFSLLMLLSSSISTPSSPRYSSSCLTQIILYKLWPHPLFPPLLPHDSVTNLKFHRVTSEISFRFVQKTLSNSG